MPNADEWASALPVDTSEDVHVTSPTRGVHVFYTEQEGEFVRTDRVVDVIDHR